MSPEQARGKLVDKRADIWAFGCVLFEMLTGKRCFDGEDTTLTLAEVVKSEPDWTALPPSTSSSVRSTLKRCLQKDAKQRARDIGDVRLALDGAFDGGAHSTRDDWKSPPRVWQRGWIVAVTALVSIGLSVVVVSFLPRAAPSPPELTTRVALVAPEGVGPGGEGVGRHVVAISPAGTHVAYFSRAQWYLRALNQLDAVAIQGTEGARELLFAPDGQEMAFFRLGELRETH